MALNFSVFMNLIWTVTEIFPQKKKKKKRKQPALELSRWDGPLHSLHAWRNTHGITKIF